MTERTFRIDQVCAATGIAQYRLQQWIARKYYVPLHGTKRGTCREYTMRDIVHLCAIEELVMAGLPVARAVAMLGTSPMDTAGRQSVVSRRGHAEIRLDLAPIAERISGHLT